MLRTLPMAITNIKKDSADNLNSKVNLWKAQSISMVTIVEISAWEISST